MVRLTWNVHARYRILSLYYTAEEPEKADSPAPAAPQAAAAPAPTRGTQKTRGGPAARGGKYYQRGGGTPKSPRENGAEDSTGGGERPKRTCEHLVRHF
jgi:plasminogen activator inhibitor 1 RNA-binding protein